MRLDEPASTQRRGRCGRRPSARSRSARSGVSAATCVPPVIARQCRRILCAVPRLRLAAAQLDLVVGDLDGNVDADPRRLRAGRRRRVRPRRLPRAAITGYPPEDLLLRPAFVAQARRDARQARGPHRRDAPRSSASPRPSATSTTRPRSARTGRCRASTASTSCRTTRCSTSSATSRRRPIDGPLFVVAGVRVGVTICEDAWSPTGPIITQAAGGAELVVNINASPYYAGRLHERETMLATRAADASVPVVYVNLVGGQDELVFDGASMVFDESGRARRARPASSPRTCSSSTSTCGPRSAAGCSIRAAGAARRALPEVAVSEARLGEHRRRAARRAAARRRCTRSTRRSCSAPATTSARTASPTCSSGSRAASTRRSSPRSRSTRSAPSTSPACSCRRATRATAASPTPRRSPRNLGIRTLTVPIEPAHAAFLEMLAPSRSTGTEPGPRRGEPPGPHPRHVLMTMSNKFGWMVLTTGNKSEMATGYSTLYGDMAGGFAVIKDVPKMLVYALCRDRNERAVRALIPDAVLEKPPSAELRPDQKDSDSLPDVRGARPDHRGLRRGRPLDRRARGRRARPRDACAGSPGWSTATSTSGARRPRACGCRPRRSARTGGSRSPTAGPARPAEPGSRQARNRP